MYWGARGMTQQLKVLTALPDTQILISKSVSDNVQLPATPAPGDLTPSSELHQNAHIHANKNKSF